MLAFLFITGLIFTGVGVYALIDPVTALAAPVGLQLEGISAYNQLRASAGAVPLVAGLFMMSSVRKETRVVPALWLVTLILGGLILGRILSLLIDGMPGSTNFVMLGAESFGFVQALYWLRQETTALTDI